MLAFVSFPSAYTTDLVQKALAKQVPGCKILREAARLHQVQMREVKILQSVPDLARLALRSL